MKYSTTKPLWQLTVSGIFKLILVNAAFDNMMILKFSDLPAVPEWPRGSVLQ